jgi:DNA (cytosine-5)-methyltransferase 1
MVINNKKPTVIDLFCGCGGLSRGFLDAGYNVLLGVDNDSAALKTFKRNHSDAEILEADLSRKDIIEKIENITGESAINVIVAGPPCQGFSLTGPRNFDDKRNKLYLSVIHIVSKTLPEAFLIENVPGLATLYEGKIKTEIEKRFENMGYNVSSKVLLAADYGVPQIRRRVFFVGLKNKLGKFEFPEKTHSLDRYVSCSDAIGELPARQNEVGKETDVYDKAPITVYQKKMRNGSTELFNHVATSHSKMVMDVIAMVPEGANYKSLPPGVGESRRFNEAWTRYHSKKPSKTIDTGHRNHFHYKYNRVPTVRENARLQSFTDDFIFFGTRTQQYRQVGNAVPPLIGYYLAKQLLRYIR